MLATAAVVVGLLAPSALTPAAWAGPGSSATGTVWRDANLNGIRDAGELAAANVTVQLLDATTGAVVATTTTDSTGAYQFANMADAAYEVRIVAPNGMIFPTEIAGDNAFLREGQPASGQPEAGISFPFTIQGDTDVVLNAGMQPIPRLSIQKVSLGANGCDGFAETGSPPWDAQDGPGLDAGPGNCIVRTGDSVSQQFSVGANPLPTGATVPNVIIEFDITTPDGADLELTGPEAGGLPTGCLSADLGANPPSSAVALPGGGFRITCNVGTMTNQNAIVEVFYRFTESTPVPAHAEITARAYAAQGHAVPSGEVNGPLVEVTALPQWDISKSLLTAPTATTWDGIPGFFVDYNVQIADLSDGLGGAELEWPVAFADRLSAFPNALLLTCRRKTEVANSNWDLACPELSTVGNHRPQGTDGWDMTFAPRNDTGLQQGSGVAVVRVFVPRVDAYRTIDPDWQPGDALPEGEIDWQNQLIDSEGWAMNGGQLNNGDGFEPGWNGEEASGNNVVDHSLPLTTPSLNAAKWRDQGPSYGTRVIDGVTVPGYVVRYRYYITIDDPNLLARWVDAPVSITDVLSYKREGDTDWRDDAHLIGCTSSIAPGLTYQRGTVSCPPVGEQPDGGWDVTYAVNGTGLNQHIGSWAMTYFIPMDEVPPGTCVGTRDFFEIRNEVQGTESWTINGAPINGTGPEPGYEPGWGPEQIAAGVASGDNLAHESLSGTRPAPDCGTWRGLKQYYGVPGGETNFSFINPGDVIGTRVQVAASTEEVIATDIVLCDVFDVSTMRIYGNPTQSPPRVSYDPHLNTDLDPADYVIEYAIGSNAVDTQAGANERGVDSTQNAADVASCKDDTERVWTTDPAAAFGADWRDHVNMVRARPITTPTVAEGPFVHRLEIPLQVRQVYNGGPDAGEILPSGIQLHNGGGWTDRDGATWFTGSERRPINIRTDGWKQFTADNGQVWNDAFTFAGQLVRSDVVLRSLDVGNAPVDTDGPAMVDPTACDVFDVSVFRLESSTLMNTTGLNPAEYVIEYAVGSNAVDTQVGGTNDVDRSSLVADVTGCRDHTGPWVTNPADFGPDWANRVNMVRVRPVAENHVEFGNFQLVLRSNLRPRGVYNGGPNAGEVIPQGTRLSNTGGWTTGDGSTWSILEREMRFNAMSLGVGKTVERPQYLPGETAVWNFTLNVVNGEAGVGAVMNGVRLVDTIPIGLTYDAACTQSRLPDGVVATYDPVTRQITFLVGDVEVIQSPTQAVFTAADPLQLCTTVSQLAQPGDTYVNGVQATAENSANAPTAQSSLRVTGAGQLGVDKDVDKPYVASGEEYVWSIDWANTSQNISFLPVDMIDVLPWVGDGEDGALSERIQFGSDYTGTVGLEGALAPPTYLRGPAGAVPGTWYYATADPSTIDHNPQPSRFGGPVANDNPEAPGGLWLTAAEIEAGAGFAAVTAVRFVSAGPLPPQSRVRALVPSVSVTTDVGMLYVNRAQIWSETFRLQPLLSNEPYVQIPGFSVGDLVWLDRIPDGRYNANEDRVLRGVTVELLDAGGDVIATRVTDSDGRWSVDALPPGEYRARIPAAMFQDGGPLEEYVVSTIGSNPATDLNENRANKNTATSDPTVSGLTSSPITVAYRYSAGANPQLIGGNGPLTEDVAQLAPPLVTPDFTTFTIDLMVNEDPAVDIEKATNAVNPRDPLPSEDADAPTGPYVAPGSAVTWTYLVTNTGVSDLYDITVTDDQVAAEDIDCGNGTNVIPGPIARLETVLCTATGVATAGQYENLGEVEALGPPALDENGMPLPRELVGDEDMSHYFGAEASVAIEKATNGLDADLPQDAPAIPVGDEVVWTYVVANTGNVDLTDLVVTDDMVDASEIDCGDGDNTVEGPLAPGDSLTCEARGIADPMLYVNTGRVVANPPFDPTTVPPEVAAPVTDTDPAHYVGIDVDIEKSTNTIDADDPAGPLIAPGDPVRWEYVVTNTGAADLTDVRVTDDRVPDEQIDCGGGTNVVSVPLAPGESVRCEAMGVAGEGTDDDGRYANLGTVTAEGPVVLDDEGEPLPPVEVDDEDPSHYWTSSPEVDIEKSTNGHDADAAPGPLVTLGGAVRWTYVVTNTGPLDLFDVTVTDDRVDPADIDCDGTGGNVIAGPLAPGESYECVAAGTAIRGQYVNRGEVTAVGPQTTGVDGAPVPGAEVEDGDPSHYFGAEPAVDIEKATNGDDADTPTGPTVTVGDPVRWTYVVENTGNVALFDVIVRDDRVAPGDIDCEDTGSNVIIGPLAPGDSVTCVAAGIAAAGQYANLGSVTAVAPQTFDASGEPVPPVPVADEDWSHYFGANAEVDIEKHTNTHDADEPAGPLVAVDGAVRWTYVVTNTGNVELTDVVVTDDRVAAAEIDCGDGTNRVAGPLAIGASFECVATGLAAPGQYANLGTVTALGPPTTDVEGEPVPPAEVEDEDWSHYFGPVPAIDIEKHTNGEDADDPTGPSIPVGGAVTWTYVVTNTGNSDLFDVTVTDDRVAASEIDCGEGTNIVAGPLAAGESIECVARGVAEAGQYANLGTVVATPPATVDVDGNPVPPSGTVTDEDRSHYLGVRIGLELVKQAAVRSGVPSVGDVVTYRFVLTNVGDARVIGVRIADNMPGLSQIAYSWPALPGVLEPGESVEAWATYVISEADVRVGEILNTARATATPDGPGARPLPPVTSREAKAMLELANLEAGLAVTGQRIPHLAWVAGLILLLAGALVVSRPRRSTRGGRSREQ